MVRPSGEALVACTSSHLEAAERTALGALVSAVRRDAPSVDVREMPVDALASAVPRSSRPAEWLSAPVTVLVPLALGEGSVVSDAVVQAGVADPATHVARPLGPDWSLAEVVVRRLIEAGARKDDTIVLGVEGSDQPGSARSTSRAARLVSAVWGGPVHVGTVGGGGTPLLDAVDIARAYGRRVVLASYALTPGPVHDVLRRSGADLVTAPFLDGGQPDARLVQLVIDRFHQALGLRVAAL